MKITVAIEHDGAASISRTVSDRSLADYHPDAQALVRHVLAEMGESLIAFLYPSKPPDHHHYEHVDLPHVETGVAVSPPVPVEARKPVV